MGYESGTAYAKYIYVRSKYVYELYIAGHVVEVSMNMWVFGPTVFGLCEAHNGSLGPLRVIVCHWLGDCGI